MEPLHPHRVVSVISVITLSVFVSAETEGGGGVGSDTCLQCVNNPQKDIQLFDTDLSGSISSMELLKESLNKGEVMYTACEPASQ